MRDSALHFESVKGFGEWRIFISTRADKNLREAHRRDPKSFKITVKKLRELSNGHFSDDNQRKLNGPKTDVPIFEAKMTRDTRLVMDNRLWESIGRQLGNKGKEYRRRCIHRERVPGARENVFLPASFPPLETEATETPVGISLPPDDLEQIHSLLVLEKYLMFSQELLHSTLPFD
ncbi:hypothetical protein C0993_002571 [Termitomyces sp. T159_Od127]|nr:hypothetical protein C0993_002571 [Termitomyces sp. T159_Od127]